MDKETFEKHKAFAGEKKPSMLRRRVGHDYQSRRVYLITMTVEGRRPLLGTLVGSADAPDDSPDAPRLDPSPLGLEVQRCWFSIHEHYPEVEVLSLQLMPDHMHGILFVTRQMEQHLGMILKGFKAGCNKAYRQYPSAATVLQQRETGRKDDRSHGFLFSRNYNDHILEGAGELERWFQYLHDNPRRLAVRRSHPDYFRVCFGITIEGQSYAAIGNRFLLDSPEKVQVQCSRRLTEEQVAETVAAMLAKGRRGAVLVSPAISKGEQAVMRAALDAHLPIIFLTPWGFNEFSKPGHQYFEACAEGRFLILAPWPHENQRIPLTRNMCQALNAMTTAICQELHA
jgi:REP element-mobilizing transposase RayT